MFAEVAQEVLEYLGVPHDIEVRPVLVGSKSRTPMAEDDTADNAGDFDALKAATDELPDDDPLRAAPASALPPSQSAEMVNGASGAASPTTSGALPPAGAKTQPQPGSEVVISQANRIKVPQLVGLPVRKAIEEAAALGLEVEISGHGTVREQAPAAGTMVEPATRVAVRCGR